MFINIIAHFNYFAIIAIKYYNEFCKNLGMWDAWPKTNQWGKPLEDGKAVVKFARQKNMEHACQELIEKSEHFLAHLRDPTVNRDCSSIIIDVVPSQ